MSVGRPREYAERHQKNVRLPVEMNDRLRAVAAEREVSANSIINHAVKDFLDRLIPLNELTLTRNPTDNIHTTSNTPTSTLTPHTETTP